jgi:predicted metalloprotease with PDZ domain
MNSTPNAKCDFRMLSALQARASQMDRSAGWIIRQAVKTLTQGWAQNGTRIKVKMAKPMTHRLPLATMPSELRKELHQYCAANEITLSQGLREAIGLYLGLAEPSEEESNQTKLN